ncbi:hypothetical protein I7I48_04585 [Histoplasma ohiense]|nr:hypothetical protein I7I48_04585 [Histoplasma ohiense (nom. inval.)]
MSYFITQFFLHFVILNMISTAAVSNENSYLPNTINYVNEDNTLHLFDAKKNMIDYSEKTSLDQEDLFQTSMNADSHSVSIDHDLKQPRSQNLFSEGFEAKDNTQFKFQKRAGLPVPANLACHQIPCDVSFDCTRLRNPICSFCLRTNRSRGLCHP